MSSPARSIACALAGVFAAGLLTTTPALAGSGVGGVFNLGTLNTVDHTTRLKGNADGTPQLWVQSNGTAAGIRADAGPGIAVNGISVSGIGQLGKSTSGVGLLGWHGGSTGTAAGLQGRTNSSAGACDLRPERRRRLNARAVDEWRDDDSRGKRRPRRLGRRTASVTGRTGRLGGVVLPERHRRLRRKHGLLGRHGRNDRRRGSPAQAYWVPGPNEVRASFGTVAGGQANTAGPQAAVGGGSRNFALGAGAVIGGGFRNGALGAYATVPGGSWNGATGTNSLVAGFRARAQDDGSFVWSDLHVNDFASSGPNQFDVRADRVWLGDISAGSPSFPSGRYLNTGTGGYLSSAGVWTNASDRALKHGFRPVNDQALLGKLARMPIATWSYKAERPSVRHLGPTAQDFYQAFGLGLDEKHIATIDEGGVALAAIQGLYRQNNALERQNAALRRQNAAQNARLTRLERTVAALSR